MPPVLTIGATNLVETLDQALLRPGRFDRKIAVDLPDADGRREILEYYLAKVKHETWTWTGWSSTPSATRRWRSST